MSRVRDATSLYVSGNQFQISIFMGSPFIFLFLEASFYRQKRDSKAIIRVNFAHLLRYFIWLIWHDTCEHFLWCGGGSPPGYPIGKHLCFNIKLCNLPAFRLSPQYQQLFDDLIIIFAVFPYDRANKRQNSIAYGKDFSVHRVRLIYSFFKIGNLVQNFRHKNSCASITV